jgi:hypothetical protein
LRDVIARALASLHAQPDFLENWESVNPELTSPDPQRPGKEGDSWKTASPEERSGFIAQAFSVRDPEKQRLQQTLCQVLTRLEVQDRYIAQLQTSVRQSVKQNESRHALVSRADEFALMIKILGTAVFGDALRRVSFEEGDLDDACADLYVLVEVAANDADEAAVAKESQFFELFTRSQRHIPNAGRLQPVIRYL